jgi:hypothetical protein
MREFIILAVLSVISGRGLRRVPSRSEIKRVFNAESSPPVQQEIATHVIIITYNPGKVK